MSKPLVTMKVGEKGPVYGVVTVATGTITLSGTPTCTLYAPYETGVVVATYPKSVTGFDAPDTKTIRCWANVDWTGMAAGIYTMVFFITLVGSDSMTRYEEPNVDIQVLPAYQ